MHHDKNRLTSQVKLWIHLQYMEFKIGKTELYSNMKVVNIFSYRTALAIANTESLLDSGTMNFRPFWVQKFIS